MRKEPGTYVLVLHATQGMHVQVGRRGGLKIQPGYYLYVGSAFGPGGVKARVSRHARADKKKHWHIDYLREHMQPVEAWCSYDDRRLEHDFFYVMNDHRCEGDSETNCGDTPHAGDTWCSAAHESYNGDSNIRATRRTNRDFDRYYPGGSSETFGETNAYYWARWFSQWLKPSLDAMGVLPGSASNYTRVLIITNACTDDRSYYTSTYEVTTDSNKGERGSVIRLGHRDPADSSTNEHLRRTIIQ